MKILFYLNVIALGLLLSGCLALRSTGSVDSHVAEPDAYVGEKCRIKHINFDDYPQSIEWKKKEPRVIDTLNKSFPRVFTSDKSAKAIEITIRKRDLTNKGVLGTPGAVLNMVAFLYTLGLCPMNSDIEETYDISIIDYVEESALGDSGIRVRNAIRFSSGPLGLIPFSQLSDIDYKEHMSYIVPEVNRAEELKDEIFGKTIGLAVVTLLEERK